MHHPANEFSLFVGDLPQDCSDDKLQRLFQQKFKSVKRVQIIRNEDGSSRGFGFIRFEDRADFQAALTQEMKIGNTTLRLDTAHTRESRFKSGRNRYNSYNSTGNNSNHHNHHHHHHFNTSGSHNHHNQHHHNHPNQHHGGQHHQNPNNNSGSKGIQLDHGSGGGVGITGLGGVATGANQHHHHQQQPLNARSLNSGPSLGAGSASSSLNPIGISSSGSSSSNISHHHPVHHAQHTHHGAHPNNNHFGSSQQQQQQQQQPNTSSNQNQISEANKNKQPTQFGIDSAATSQSAHNQNPTPSQHTVSSQNPNTPPTQTLSQNSTQQNLLQVSSTSAVANTTNTSNNVNHTNTIHNHNLNANQQAIGPDLRGYTAATMMDTHILGAPDQPSMMPPTSVYGHLYPYGPPPFGYMHHPPQPNPVIPISAVPPAAPNQTSPSAGIDQQQQGHSIQANNAQRYNSGQHQHHHQHHQSHQGAHATDGSLNTIPGGVQAAHQAPPLYYYYPSPLYFDQAGGAAAPPSIYHTQPFHPQFFAMPNPAYMPNAHTFNQHQQQPPTASQSDAPVISPQQHQANLRTRDIDTTIE